MKWSPKLSSVVLEFVEVLSRTKMVTVLLYNSLLRPQLKSSLSSEHQFKVLRKISIIQDLCLTEARKLKIQFSSVTQSCPTLCDPTDCSTPGFSSMQESPVEAWGSHGLLQGSGHWMQQCLHGNFWRRSPLLHYLHHSLASGQTTGREHSPALRQKFELK